MKELLKKITVSDNYIVRQPLLPKSILFDLADDHDYKKVKKLMESTKIREAIYISSPSLLNEWDRRKNTTKQDLLLPKLFKYITRMSYRCTPFGLSAGVTAQTFNKKKKSKPTRRTRLDSQIEYLLFQYVINSDILSKELAYVVNTSLYESHGFYRYLKDTGTLNKSNWVLQKTSISENLALSIAFSENSITKANLEVSLVKEGYTIEDAKTFILSLINAQILVPELLPYLVGPPYFYSLINYLNKHHEEQSFVKDLNQIKKQLLKLDFERFNHTDVYKKIIKQLKDYLNIDNIRNPFHVELFNNSKQPLILKKEKQALKRSVEVLVHFAKNQNDMHASFFDLFVERYPSTPVKLIDVIDSELGLGFPANRSTKFFWYLEGLNGLKINRTQKNITTTMTELMLKEKLLAYHGIEQIKILREDLTKDNPLINKFLTLAPTFSGLTEKLLINNKVHYYSPNLNMRSATSLFARFSGHDKNIDKLLQEIVLKESEQLKDDFVPFEIEHYANKKVGNITSRSSLRNKRLSYLSGKYESNVEIKFENLYLSIKSGKLLLTIGSDGESLMPFLSNSHNYPASEIPLYLFLSNFSTFHYGSSYRFDWASIEDYQIFLPRVIFQNIILSKATWRFNKSHFSHLDKLADKQKISELKTVFIKWKLPKFVCLVDEDKKTIFDLHSIVYLRLFLTEIRNKHTIILEEDFQLLHSEFPKANEFLFIFNYSK